MDRRVPDPDGALYHLAEDPGERVNLYGSAKYAEIIARLEALART
jgi:hypothetical protein